MIADSETQAGVSRKPSLFSSLPQVAGDEIFALSHAYIADNHPQKVSLGIGVYRTNEGKPWPLPSVRKAEEQLLAENDITRHEYLAIEGDVKFLDLARDLMFGFEDKNESPAQQQAKQRIASVQTVSGTGANHVGALFLAMYLKPKTIWLSNPSWANHTAIWDLAGVPRKTYPYYNAATRSFDFEGAMRTLEEEAQEGDAILLHACAHNPTGLDPTKEQWKAIADLCERKGIFPFFDSAYQGFASGSLEEDAWAVRYFFNEKPGMEMCVAQSFSKNCGLYGQRVGAFHLVTNGESPDLRERAVKNLCHIIRGEYSMAPRHGSEIVKKILTNEQLKAEWIQDLDVMSSRIKKMRKALYDELVRLGTPGTWEHIVKQNGMFSYTGLTPQQVLAMKEKYHIYLLKSGRASVSGLTEKNVEYVARAIDDVVRNVA
ncbi:hypothetical protein VTN00DRAFT_8959 [Thermoascus crustaceus]|uniref:uncharacterized protein n=1 Tax=Thermoascus crustaceus TaxID=5088 RepID=UPI00374205E7